MRIAYVTTYDAQNVLSWSGVPYYMANALKAQSLSVDYVGPLREMHHLVFKAKQASYQVFLKKVYRREREPAILKGYAKQIGSYLRHLNPDIILSPSTIPVAYLECDQPIVVWTDATFGSLVNYYPEYSNLCEESFRNGHLAEKSALDRASLVIYQSDWAAQMAIDQYQISPAKVNVVPYGANLECDRTTADIESMIAQRPTDRCRLLFYGANWQRKGGDVAVEVTKRLNQLGLPTELYVIGGQPTASEPLPDFIQFFGLISKSTEAGRKQIEQLLCESHFLILPTRADCSPIAFPEANSFGVPSLATNVGGISTPIKNNLNGRTFNLDADPTEYCDYILSLFEDYNRYRQLALSSFDEFQSRLNWSVAGKAVKTLLAQL
jgi:glycosyltransferase involved in cell wall biosynthesis